MADRAGAHVEEHLAGLRRLDRELLDHERLAVGAADCCLHAVGRIDIGEASLRVSGLRKRQP